MFTLMSSFDDSSDFGASYLGLEISLGLGISFGESTEYAELRWVRRWIIRGLVSGELGIGDNGRSLLSSWITTRLIGWPSLTGRLTLV